MAVAIKRWLGAFAPAPVGVNLREKLYGALGALVGLFCTEWVGHHALGNANPWFIAPMGASAVLLFAALDASFNMIGVDAFLKQVLRGAIVIAAVAVHAVRQKGHVA